MRASSDFKTCNTNSLCSIVHILLLHFRRRWQSLATRSLVYAIFLCDGSLGRHLSSVTVRLIVCSDPHTTILRTFTVGHVADVDSVL